jgi:hypothetical protein
MVALFPAIALGLSLAVTPPTATGSVGAAKPFDFNGDGYADLAIGVSYEDVGNKENAGAINVLYGSVDGLTPAGDQYWNQDSPGVRGVSQGDPYQGDYFATVLTSDDFDRDGHADLAIGVPQDEVDGVWPGAVNILYGSTEGLTADGDDLLTQANLPDNRERDDSYGGSLASADFDGDGYGDLAIGASHEDFGWIEAIGIVEIRYGAPGGLAAGRVALLTPAMAGLPEEEFLRFGTGVEAGDFDGDGYADLAVQAIGQSPSLGTITQFFGGAAGLAGDHTATLAGGWWGALAVGDFDDDGNADLAHGSPRGLRGGTVSVLYGSTSGLDPSTTELWHQDVPGVPDTDEKADFFGYALATGDLDGDGADDLAIGAPREDLGETPNAGSVTLLFGSQAGLVATGAQRWTQASPGVPDRPERGDQFGFALAIADYGRSSRADLAVGTPLEDLGAIKDAGLVNVLYGTSTGPTGTKAQAWTQDSGGIGGSAERYDEFGSTLAP